MNEVAIRAVAASADQDRVRHVSSNGIDIIILADGAGGLSGGAEAAELVVRHDFGSCLSAPACAAQLTALDAEISTNRAAGETTAVVAMVHGGIVCGASVGDSGAWLLGDGGIIDLTQHQRRKPLLGSGSAVPEAFGPIALAGRLLLASDGLLKYVAPDRIYRLGRGEHLERAAESLVAAARLPGGGLQDDLSLALVTVPARGR